MADPTAFALAFLSAPVQYPNAAQLELDTHIKTEPDTQPVLFSNEQQTDAYPSSHPSLPTDAAAQYQLSLHASSLPAAPAPVRPPPLNLGQHSNMYRINSVTSGPITPCTPYLPLSNLPLQGQSFGTVNSSPMSNVSAMSQPLSAYSSFSSIVSPTLSSPSTYSNASQDVLATDFSPSLSTTFSPQLSSTLSVTDLGLAPQNTLALPDDMMDICKVEPDVDLDDHPVGPVVVNTVVPSALTAVTPVHFNSSPPLSLSANNNLKPTDMPSTPPSAKSFYASPPRTRHRNGPPLPPMLLHPPPPPKPGFGQKLKYVFKPPRAASPVDDLRHLEIPEHIRDAYGTRRRQWSVNGAMTPRCRAATPNSPTPPNSPPAPYLRRHSSESEDVDELLSDSQTHLAPTRSPSPDPPLRSVSTPDLRSVSSLSDNLPYTSSRSSHQTLAKRKATQPPEEEQRQRPRAGEKRMSQNRTAQKKYRDKNRRLADLRAEFNITPLVLVEKVSRGEITEKKAFSQLAGHSRVFKHHMKNTCGTTFDRLMASVEEALNDSP